MALPNNYPPIVMQDDVRMDPESIMVIIVPMSLLISEVCQRLSEEHSPVVTFRRLYALLLAGIVILLTQYTSFLDILSYSKMSAINKIFTSLFVPFDLLFLICRLNIRLLFRKLHIVLMFCILLIISSLSIGYVMNFLHGSLTWVACLMIASTLSTPQPQALMSFLSASDSYRTIVNYLQGESLLSMLLTIPVNEMARLYLTGDALPIMWSWVFLFSPCVGIVSGMLIAKVVSVFVRKVHMSLEAFCCVLMGVLITMYVMFLGISYSICGLAAAMAYCLVIVCEKEMMLEHREHFIVVVNFLHEVIDHVTFFYSMVKAATLVFNFADISVYFYCYLLLTATRIVSAILVYAIFRHSEKFRLIHLLIFAMVTPTGNFSLRFARDNYMANNEVGSYGLAHCFFNIVCSILINKLIGINLLKWSRLTLVTKQRAISMEVIMQNMKNLRNECVTNLMKDRTYAEANWASIYKYVRFNVGFPYPMSKKPIDWSNSFSREYDDSDPDRFACCRNVCPAISKGSLRTLQLEQLTLQLETLVVVLSAIVKRMKEHCLISNECEKMLVTLLPLYKIDSHDILETLADNKSTDTCRRMLYKIRALAMQSRTETRPRRRFYRICFQLLENRIYNMIMYASSMLCLFAPIVFSVTSYPHFVDLIVFDCSLMLSLVNFVVNIGARSRIVLKDGIRIYFTYLWGILDFISLLAIMTLSICSHLNVMYTVIIALGVIASSGSLRRLILILYGAKDNINMHVGVRYECAIALTICLDEAMLTMERMLIEEVVLARLRSIVYSDKAKLGSFIAGHRLHSPVTTNTIMTRNIMLSVRCCKRDYLSRLRIKGVIDNDQMMLLSRLHVDCHRHVPIIIAPSPSELFQNVYWLNTNKKSYTYLKSEAKLCKWPAGHELCHNGEVVTGIYLLIGGQLRIGHPRKLQAARSLRYREFEGNLVTRGNTFGEIELLMGGKYPYTAVCEVDSRAYYFSLKTILHAMTLSSHPIDGLDAVLWKHKMLPHASLLIMRHPLYKYLSQWQINKMIQSAFVPDLRCYKIFAFVDSISDLILVSGVVLDFDTKERYTAPKLIPRTCRKLILTAPKMVDEKVAYPVTSKLFIIPMGQTTAAEVLAQLENDSILIDHDFSACVHHVAQVRGKVKQRIPSLGDRMFSFTMQHTAALGIGSRKSLRVMEESIKDLSIKMHSWEGQEHA